MWTKIAGFILRNRLTLLIIIGVITIFMGWQMTKVKMDYHYATMLSEKDPVYLNNLEFKKTFGEEANGIFIGIVDENFFNIEHYKRFQILCDSLKEIPNVKSVLGIPQAVNIRQITVDNGENKKRLFEIYKLFPENISSQAELDSLKTIFYDLPFYNGLLMNKSKNIFLLSVTLKNEILDSPERIPTVEKIEKTIQLFSETANVKTYISGHPFIRTKLMTLIRSEIVIFIILAALISILILFLFFRKVKTVAISIAIVVTAVIWAMGTMGLFHYKITILTAMIPPLLIIIGIPNFIYLLNYYHTETKRHSNKVLALQRTICRKGTAVFLSNLTTAVGFGTFMITNSQIMVEFGLVASLGIMFTFLLAMIVIPIVFSFLQPPSEKYTKHLENHLIQKILDKITIITTRYRKSLYIVVGAILILSVFGIINIKRTGFIMDDVPHSTKMYQDLKFLESSFNGVSPLEIMIKTKDSLSGNEFISQIEKIDSLQTELSQYKELSRSVSIADAVKFLNQAYSKGKVENYCLPENPKTYETIFKRLPSKLNFNDQLLNSFIDSTKTVTRISLNIADIGTNRMEKLVPEISADINHYFPPEKYHTVLTGSTIMYFTGTTYLIKNLFSSLILAFIIIGLLLYWMFRSIKMTLLALIPNVIPMLTTAALMGLFGIPLKPSTILVFGIAFGISVDGTIHFVNKFRRDWTIKKLNIGTSVNNSINEVGISLVYNATILFFGFIIFSISDFGGTQALGILVSITLLVSVIANLVILPSLLLSLEKFYDRKTFGSAPIEITDEDETDEIKENNT